MDLVDYIGIFLHFRKLLTVDCIYLWTAVLVKQHYKYPTKRVGLVQDIQIPPSLSTIILSCRTQSFVGLEECVTLKIVRQNPPR